MIKLFYQCMCTYIHCFNLISRKRIKWGCFIIYPDISKKERCLASYKQSLWATNPCFLYKWRLRLPVGPPLDSNEKNYLVLSFWFKEAQPVLLHMWTCWRCSQGADPAQRRRRASREAWTEITWPCFLSHRGTWREKYGGWQPILSCPSVQRWATIKHFGSGNYPPNTVCWQYESSKKVWDATLHICQSICQQQRVLCSSALSCCLEYLVRAPTYARSWEVSVGCYRQTFQKAGLIHYFLRFPCTAQTFTTWGQYVLLLLVESCESLLEPISL